MLDRLLNPAAAMGPLFGGYIVLVHALIFAAGVFLTWPMLGERAPGPRASRIAAALIGMWCVSTLCWNPGLWWAKALPDVVSAPMFWMGASTILARESGDTFRIAIIWALYWTWILGSTIVALRLVVGNVMVLLNVTLKSIPSQAELNGELATASRQIGVRGRVKLRISESTQVPFTWGILRPVIVLPSAALNADAESRKLVLLHELAHVKRRDTLVLLLADIAFIWYWFVPIVWMLRRRLRMLAEHAADTEVVESGVRARDYGMFLLTMSDMLAQKPRLASAFALVDRHSITNRIALLLSSPKKQHRMSAHMIGLALCMMWAAFIGTVRLSPQRDFVLSMLASDQFATRTYAVGYLLKSKSPDADALLDNAARDPHPVVRRMALHIADLRR